MQNETIHTEFSPQAEASLESLPPRMAAVYDDKRFPTKWQAMIGAASMQILGVIASMLLGMLLLIGAFRTQFGYTMFNYVCSQLIMVVSIPLFMLMVCRKDLRTTVRLKKGIDAVQIGLLLLVSMGAFFLCQHLNGIFVQILSIFMGEPADLGLSEGATDLTQLLFQIVIVAGLPAICEELFFRGFVLRAFERISVIAAVVLSSVVFAVMHGNLQQLVYAFLIGILLGTVVTVSDSLLAGAVIHFFMNLFSVGISYGPVYSQYLAFVEENPLAYMMVVFFISPALLAIGLMLFIKYTRHKNMHNYQAYFVSDLKYPRLMPKQKSGGTALYVIGWIVFVFLNVVNMIVIWFGDALLRV